MKTSLLKVGGVFSLVMTSMLVTACGAGDINDFDSAMGDEGEYSEDVSEDVELGSLEQGLHGCATPDGTNAVMAALAVAAAQELGRWRASDDFTYSGDKVVLSSGTGSDGKPKGKSRCSGSVCKKIEALLALQYDNATGVYVQAETANTKVQVNPGILRQRMTAKLYEQTTKDRDMKDGDLNQAPKTGFTLTGAGTQTFTGGCGPHFKFNVAFAASTTTPKPLPGQLKWSLSFADQQNGWVDFRDLGNNVVAIDPTYGLNEGSTSTAGSCEIACTKVSTATDVSNLCCSCAGVQKTFKRSTFSTSVYLCQ